VEREAAIKPLHHRRHVGKEPIGGAVLSLLEDGRKDQAADLFLEERQAGHDKVGLGEMQILQDFIHPVGTVMDDGDAVAEFPLQQIHIGLFELDEDDVSPRLAAGDQFMGKGAVAGTEFYDGLYFIPVDSGDDSPAGGLRTRDHRGIAERVFQEVEQEEGALFPDIMVYQMRVSDRRNAKVYSDFCQFFVVVVPHGWYLKMSYKSSPMPGIIPYATENDGSDRPDHRFCGSHTIQRNHAAPGSD